VPAWTWLAFVVIAAALYRNAILVGYLSDDFVLSDRASHWMLGPVTPLLFRPLPLLLWAVVSWAGGGAVVLHMLAIVFTRNERLPHGESGLGVGRTARSGVWPLD
jgi:hypothetical protein